MREALQGAVINVVGSQALHKGQAAAGLYGEGEVYALQPTKSAWPSPIPFS